jgi:hypothetical protein
MAGPGMSDSIYRQMSRTAKRFYWLMVVAALSLIAYVWFGK